MNQTQKIDELLRYAIEHEASDLHISVGYPPIVRIDGELKEISDSIITAKDAEDFVLPLLSDEKKELLQVNKEIDFAYFYNKDLTGRFRINAFYTMKNLAAAFRLIPTRIRTIDELLLPQLYHQFSQLKQGLILVTGPTGHGKSTTLAAILEEVNTTRFSHIITIEDPIEYVFEGKKALIEQREMNDDTHSWSIALRSALRQDPDVILVGEMRDYETIASAITLAETGHLVFATLHTNNAAQTVDRIIDVFPNNQQAQIRLQLSNILEAIVAQRLIPLDKGGRRAVSEIMVASPAIRNMIREAKTHQIDNVIRTSSDIGMVSLEKSLVGLIREGVISVQRAQEYAVFPEEVLRLLKS
ncbi:type IV pili twitching motility protein PilT [candidate division WS6 bacterium RIFOXYC1_FULL_33_9]|nr:MAG: type IV pili twitching motility protein PilT [candidate division WS6 bacterium RIFOXYB1_FULL_33_15]OGC37898.1 MAG: type IV pili twitching motility protein PilT [candidate division WS6 bacterium RIFOXYC1_FULL_33_9]HBB64390.1 type IV pili twitching motility protein PilT [Patescibacteria group bacterium]